MYIDANAVGAPGYRGRQRFLAGKLYSDGPDCRRAQSRVQVPGSISDSVSERCGLAFNRLMTQVLLGSS